MTALPQGHRKIVDVGQHEVDVTNTDACINCKTPLSQIKSHACAGICSECGRDNRNGTHSALEGLHLNHEFTPNRAPTIVVLCGSTRFFDAFQKANYDLTMQGRIVLSVGFYPHAIEESGHGEGVGHDSAQKIVLDELHKRKIDLADEVFILNVDGYIGDSTRSEIEYAVALNKPITYLEPFGDVKSLVPVCSTCRRERTIGDGDHPMDSYDYSPMQVVTGKPFGWYSGDDGEVCPECMEKTIRGQR